MIMGKICLKCGSIVEDNAKFCDECGEPLTRADENTSSPTINMYANEEGFSNTQPQTNVYNPECVQNTGGKVSISTGKKVLGIVSLICGIASIITIGCWFFLEIAAIVCGVLAKDVNGKRTKLGKAGFICGIIGSSLLILVIIIALL